MRRLACGTGMKNLNSFDLARILKPRIFFPASNVPGYPPDDITTHTEASCDQRKSPSLTRPSMEASSASTRSLSRRIKIGCVSGSPKRQLNSSTMGPRAVIISPQYRIPLYSAPSAFIPAITGRAICCTSHCASDCRRSWESSKRPCLRYSDRYRRRRCACDPGPPPVEPRARRRSTPETKARRP